jgi:hypothetical protein
MTQQPNQNYPQPGQGWGQPPQQPQQAPQWGQQQPQQAAPQWGQPQAQQPVYGQQPQQAPQWGTPAVSTPSGSGAAVVAKAWALYAALGAAVVSVVMVFLPWADVKVDGLGGFDVSLTPFQASSGGKSSGDGIYKVWGILLIVGAVVAIAGGVLVLTMKKAQMVWILVGGTAVILIAAIAELIYLNNKMSDFKKAMTAEAAAGSLDAGAKYSIGLSVGAYIAVVVGVAAVAFAVLAALSAKAGATAASPSAYGAYGQPAQQAYGQQAAYGEPQQPQWGQQQPQAQPQWGQPAPQQQPQWGAPAQDAPNPFADPANQPTQAVQQYPPQPPQ